MSDLERLVQLLAVAAPLAGAVSVRGEGRAAFLLVEGSGRVVEAGRTGGQWWVELWGGGEDEAAPVQELLADTDQEAVAAITAWLR